ncbi:MAG: hypothetical protein B6229_08425, partial [Spirochaetaceae bacterium 4572_7]
MYNKDMKRIIARLYTFIITLLIVLGLLFLLNEIKISRSDYIKESIKVSQETKNIIEKNWFKHKNFTNQGLTDELAQQMKTHPNLHSIIIYSKEKGLIKFNSQYNDRKFLLNNLVSNDPNWNLRPEYSFNWWDNLKNNIISTPVQVTEQGYSFDLIYNTLSSQKIENVLKDAFIIVIVFFILTIIVIILFSIWRSKYLIDEYNDDQFKP